MMFIENYGTKKMYHFLKENNKKGNQHLIVFPDKTTLAHYSVYLDALPFKFPESKIHFKILTNDKTNQNSNEIYVGLLTRQNLSNFTCVFKIPSVLDHSYDANDIVGLNTIPKEIVNKYKSPILDYYGFKEYVVFEVEKDDDIDLYTYLIDYLQDLNIKSVLVGNKTAINLIANTCITNPLVFYDRVYITKEILMKALVVVLKENSELQKTESVIKISSGKNNPFDILNKIIISIKLKNS